ncbi:questin oxidase family protein [Nocardia arthritidis]|uniref:DUF4243 domain-containing protein n=1 Tax=Nocardia arthritidis TaxID=228602 RepID=A0A6G9YNM6_9NOCA|nr:questin oxidase family protein [Nocardia arthritidis]QIS14730.1 DUF4243 domain-containing protein [Nocardia arthritidis]
MVSLNYSDAMNEALARMDDLGYERGTDGDLANHGPMGAEALATLGFVDEVGPWTEYYRNVLPFYDPPQARFAIDPSDESSWRGALGEFDRAGDWEQLFARELAESPWRTVLVRWWPRLLPGLMASLTHGLIRTAHAVRGLAAAPAPSPAQLTELARGLAFWAARFHELPGRARMAGDRTVAEAVAALPRVPLPKPAPVGMLAQRLRTAPTRPGYRENLDALAELDPQWLLSELTAEFAGVYLAHPQGNPVPLVHAVTAPAAARLVLPHLPTELHMPTVAALWQMHLALLLTATGDAKGEGTALAAARAAEVPTFGELAARAAEHRDEHVIKFTEACLREHLLRPDPRYAAAVMSAQRRISRH